MFRSSTLDWAKRTMDPALAPQRNLADVLALGGGVPIMVGNDAIGAVASSGSSQEKDDACARAGIARVADLLVIRVCGVPCATVSSRLEV
jgi:uncharacterized protein GlcG (DUF336 family)